MNLGKRTRLHRLLHSFGPGEGTCLVLPVDQGLEHGPRDFFTNPTATDPRFQLQLARDGGFSAIAWQVGIAQKYMVDFAGEVPLILKLNGKTDIPPGDAPLSPVLASVEDACRLGAEAVGYTMYIGSARQDEDFRQFAEVRVEAEALGMPVIIWAYPRGEAMEQKGGRDSQYAVEYGARVAAEVGADMVKVNFPKPYSDRDLESPKPYDELRLEPAEQIRRVIEAASGVPVLISGGSKVSEADLLEKARLSMEAGATGLIFGRNIWQRPMEEALDLAARLKALMLDARRERVAVTTEG